MPSHLRALTAIALSLTIGVAHADDVKIQYYDVIGSTAEELRRELNLKGYLYEIGKRADGFTRWDVSWEFRYAPTPGGCELTEIVAKVEGTITLPRWVAGRDRASAQVIADWQKFITALRAHEDGHYAYAVEAADEIGALGRSYRVRGDCSRIAKRFDTDAKAVLQKYIDANATYDRRTRFGQTQGVVFPLSRAAARSSPGVEAREEAAEYLTRIRRAVEARLTYPPSERGKHCTAVITQNRSGDVLGLRLQECDSKELSKAVQFAVLDSSPLPLPADRKLFERTIVLKFIVPG